jgi:hypothetical protein
VRGQHYVFSGIFDAFQKTEAIATAMSCEICPHIPREKHPVATLCNGMVGPRNIRFAITTATGESDRNGIVRGITADC